MCILCPNWYLQATLTVWATFTTFTTEVSSQKDKNNFDFHDFMLRESGSSRDHVIGNPEHPLVGL